MARFIIEGGHPLNGEVRVAGNKNAALPMIAATLLTDDPVTLTNLPRIKDVEVLLEMLAHMGVDIRRQGRSVTLRRTPTMVEKLDAAFCRRLRGSVLLAGPMLARQKRLVLPPPGGDVIGRRRLDTHFHGFHELGVSVSRNEDGYVLEHDGLRGASFLLDEASVTATENLVMAAVLAQGTTEIYHAACEPHVQDLCFLLNNMGARIQGIGTNLLRIQGVRRLRGTTHRLAGDFMEAASYLAAAAATGGSISVKGMSQKGVADVVRRGFNLLGVPFECTRSTWHMPKVRKREVSSDMDYAICKLEDGIWPAFPSDLMSVMIVLATQTKGTVLFFEKLFESRMYFVDRLIEMGAPIVQCDPHRVVVNGPARLQGNLLTSPDIRAGMALVIAALCAQGTSIIDNAQMVDRGYEAVDVRLAGLGARIQREQPDTHNRPQEPTP